ncbi:MAG: 2'-deoxycytidine 5'-triphosphate deaminase [Alphaproteobacteria bacterium]|nr:2'-deoxycytidine 5'-triphosphate deaminase [Alphaproteobacteria bacterium]
MNASAGVLPSQTLSALIKQNVINASTPFLSEQIQPASIDLRLGFKAWRIQASFLPGTGSTVEEKLDKFALHELDLKQGAVLEKGCVYLVELQESLSLPDNLKGMANPKSSTGRLDVFTRLITDYAREFEMVAAGYSGPLYAEISPRTFSVLVRTGSRLSQLRLRAGSAIIDDSELSSLQHDFGLVRSDASLSAAALINDGIGLSVNLQAELQDDIIGWRARKHAGLVDIDKVGGLEKSKFWEAVTTTDLVGGGLVLNPDEFYILASREYVCVPDNFAAEMRAYDTKVGEFRAHYAGFFDPGFGMGSGGGGKTRAVLEVRSHDVPFLVEQDQIVCRLVYERMSQTPESLYGQAKSGSNYQAQGLKLAKHFK